MVRVLLKVRLRFPVNYSFLLNHYCLVCLLLRGGARADLHNEDLGVSPVHVACQVCTLESPQYTLIVGFEPWSVPSTRCLSGLYLGVSPVHVACQVCTLESNQYMLLVGSVPWSLTRTCCLSGLYLGV